jgi:parallel beta-helix repeat protein
MKTRNALVTAASVCGLFLTHASALAQGTLTPPGVPAPTMKTLEQIEPRTPISSLPFTITNPGSYFLTTNLTGVSGQNGVTVEANNVALDLRGFTLTGVPGSQSGIFASNYNYLTVENGTVSSWGGLGINADATSGGRFSQLAVISNNADGLDPGHSAQMNHCVACQNAGNGFGGVDYDCTFDTCTANQNNSTGFEAFDRSQFLSCEATGNGFDGFNPFPNCTFRDCNASINGFDGLDTPYAGCVVINCVCNNNGVHGINAGDNCTVRGSSAASNGGNGIITGNNCVIESCTASLNSSQGIAASNYCTLTGCAASSNQLDNIVTSYGCALSQCSAGSSLTGNGFTLGSGNNITGSSAFANILNGINAGDRTAVEGCSATLNGIAGIHVSYIGTVQHCSSVNNGSYGILSDTNGYANILENNCTFNGLTNFGGFPSQGAGIYVTNSPSCRIEGNTLNLNYVGLVVAPGSHAFIVRNSADGNISTSYSLGAGNSWGPLVNVTGVGDISGTANANQPSANFIH